MTASPSPQRVRAPHVAWVAERLNDRDRAILATLDQLHVARGIDLERLHFSDLEGRSRSVVRWRVLKRLVEWRVIRPLPRRIGGSLAGSNQLVFTLDAAGARLMDRAHGRQPRRRAVIAERAVAHRLGVTDLFVSLTVRARSGAARLIDFVVEPACWVPDGRGGWLKPDAYVELAHGQTDHWWIEYDRATEDAGVLRRKARAYVEFIELGNVPAGGVVPWVLFSVPDRARQEEVRRALRSIGRDFGLFHVSVHDQAVDYLIAQLFHQEPEALL